MTKKTALEIALATVKDPEARETIESMIAQLSKPAKPRTPLTAEQKAAVNAKRKEATAAARAELVAKVAPILRAHLTEDVTAKGLFALAEAELPEGFTPAKVQNVLLREMKPELVVTEAKGKANTYRMK